jgi:hypothetical protein
MSQPPRAPAQFSSLSDFTDELMVLSESLKRRAEGLAAHMARAPSRYFPCNPKYPQQGCPKTSASTSSGSRILAKC